MFFSVQSLHNSSYIYIERWNLEKGYDPTVIFDTDPRRTFGSGALAGITVVLGADEDYLDFLCRGPIQGFKVHKYNRKDTSILSLEVHWLILNSHVATLTIRNHFNLKNRNRKISIPDKIGKLLATKNFLKPFQMN